MHQEVTKYWDMLKRRAYWVVVPFLVVVLGGLTYALVTEPIYEAQTLILVQPQEVPENFVQPIIQREISSRIRTISQQVLSRTNLESIIREHKLYQDSEGFLEEKVERCRRNVKLDVVTDDEGEQNVSVVFKIAFRNHDPGTARDVTNALASNFISENIKIRENQALGTATFLSDELESVKQRLERKEEEIKRYREKFMGTLPDQLETNLKMLERTQSQLESLNDSLQQARNRKLLLQQQISEQQQMVDKLSAEQPAAVLDGEDQSIPVLKEKLAALRARYTENHPDVRRLKSTIENLEAEEESGTGEDPLEPEEKPTSTENMNLLLNIRMLKTELQQADFEVQRIQEDIQKTKAKLGFYQEKIEITPQREQELLSLKRNYENQKNLYNSLLNRKLEAELAVSMERKQKGEQFQILDPAQRPQVPVEPDLKVIFALTLFLGIGLGGALAYGAEMMDTSYKEPDEIREDLQLPVLITLPYRYTAPEERRQRWKRRACISGLVVGFAASVVLLVVAVKGLTPTLRFLKNLLGSVGIGPGV